MPIDKRLADERARFLEARTVVDFEHLIWTTAAGVLFLGAVALTVLGR